MLAKRFLDSSFSHCDAGHRHCATYIVRLVGVAASSEVGDVLSPKNQRSPDARPRDDGDPRQLGAERDSRDHFTWEN